MAEKTKPGSDLKVTIKPFGPTSEELEAVARRAVSLAAVRAFSGRGGARLLYVEALDDDDKTRNSPVGS